MQLFFEVTRGDALYREIPFLDQYDAPVNLNGWQFEAGFKKSFSDRRAYFTLTTDDGLAFKNADASTGILCLSIDPDQFDDLDLTILPRNGERVPFKFITGDLKMTPPDGTGLMQGTGARTAIIIKVLAGVTA